MIDAFGDRVPAAIHHKTVVPCRARHVVGCAGDDAVVDGGQVPLRAIGKHDALDLRVGVRKETFYRELCRTPVEHHHEVVDHLQRIGHPVQTHVCRNNAAAQLQRIRAAALQILIHNILSVAPAKAVGVIASAANQAVLACAATECVVAKATKEQVIPSVAKELIVTFDPGPEREYPGGHEARQLRPIVLVTEQRVIARSAMQHIVTP